jgi:ParB-like chromosome segregation protein Spo0J
MNLDKNKFKDVVTVGNKTFGYLKVTESSLSPNNIRPEISKEEVQVIKVTLLPSIDAIGMQQLPVSTPNGEIFIGGRRRQVYLEKKETWLPIEIRDTQDYDQMKDSWAENRARKDVEPLEEARHFAKMMKEKNISAEKLADELGLPHTYVKDRRQILEAFGISPESGVSKIAESKGLTKEEEKKTITYEKARVLSRDWVPKKTREKLVKKIKDEGLSHQELQRELGKGKVIQTIIEQEEKADVKAKLEEKYGGEKAFEVEPEIVLEKQRELKGLAPSLTKIELPAEQFETDAEKIDVQIHPKVMQRIVKYFLDKKGRYVGCAVTIKGEVAKSEKD